MEQNAPGQLISNSTRKLLLWGAIYGIGSFAAAGIIGGTIGGIIAVTAFIVLVPGGFIAWCLWAGGFLKKFAADNKPADKNVRSAAEPSVWERKRMPNETSTHPDLPFVIGLLIVIAALVYVVRTIS